MLRKAVVCLSIAALLSSCTAKAANTSKQASSSPQANLVTTNQSSPNPQAIPSSQQTQESNPQVSPSPQVTLGSSTQVSPSPQANLESNAQIKPGFQATPDNSEQIVLPYDQKLQGRLIVDPEAFYQKLHTLSEKFVKDQFETEQGFAQREKQEIKNFEKIESLNFQDTYVIRTPINIGLDDNYKYEYFADKKCLEIDPRIFMVDGRYQHPIFVYISVQEQETNSLTGFNLSLLSPTNKDVTDDDLMNYWLSKKRKVNQINKRLIISNLESSYTKQLLKEKRLSFEASFTLPSAKDQGVFGYLVNLKVIDTQTGNILWSLS